MRPHESEAAEIVANAKEIDPGDEIDWGDMLFGFLLGAGMPRLNAEEIVAESPFNGWEV